MEIAGRLIEGTIGGRISTSEGISVGRWVNSAAIGIIKEY